MIYITDMHFITILSIFMLTSYAHSHYPTVLMHGVLANKNNLIELKEMIENSFNVEVYNLEIGNGKLTSFFDSMNEQLVKLCEHIYSIDELKNGFNFIGISQGGLLARGYVEYCNLYPVNNLITIVTPHGGVYFNNTYSSNFYEPSNQKDMSITNYWRDPYRYELYLDNSTYLSQLNNEISMKSTQNTLDVLNNFVMIWSSEDDVVEPPESGKFSMYFVENDKLELHELENTQLYKNNFLGLKKMNEENRLHVYETECLHAEHIDPECFNTLKYVFKEFL